MVLLIIIQLTVHPLINKEIIYENWVGDQIRIPFKVTVVSLRASCAS